MSKAKLFNNQGKAEGEMELNDLVFGVKIKKDVVHQVYVAMRANARQNLAHTQDRSEVSGGGRKPWRQKGTGRARHGSIRSPLWVGGAITFGPRKNRNFKQKINAKTKNLALRMCLSDKIEDGKLIILSEMPKIEKTKQMIELRGKLEGQGKTTLLVPDKKEDKVLLATRNIQRLVVTRPADLNVVDLLHNQYVITTKKAVEILEKRLIKKKK